MKTRKTISKIFGMLLCIGIVISIFGTAIGTAKDSGIDIGKEDKNIGKEEKVIAGPTIGHIAKPVINPVLTKYLDTKDYEENKESNESVRKSIREIVQLNKEKIKEELRNARARYMILKRAEIKAVEEYKANKEKLLMYKKHKGNLTEEERFNITKEFLLNAVDRKILQLERLKEILNEKVLTHVEETPDNSSAVEAIQSRIDRIDEAISFLQEKREEIENATSLEELKEIAISLRRGYNLGKKLGEVEKDIVIEKVNGVVNKMERLYEKLYNYAVNHNDQELLEKLEEFKGAIDDAKTQLEEARSTDNMEEYRSIMRNVVKDLKDAEKTLREIVRERRRVYNAIKQEENTNNTAKVEE